MRSDRARASRPTKRLLLTAVALTALTTACGSDDSGTASSATEAPSDGAAYPVTVESCGHRATFDEAPKRAVITDVNMVEDMLALGLGDRVVGTFAVGDDTHPIGDEYRAGWEELEHVSDEYPELEPLVALKPDFVFSGWSWGLVEAKNTTPDNLATYGIKTYILAESCDWGPGSPTKTSVGMETTYADLENLGKIFDVPEQADQVIADLKAQIAAVQERVKDVTPKKVFLYDSGETAPFTVGNLGVPHDLITLAGGTNIFADEDRSWTEGSWEAVVDAQPDCIILNEYGGSSASSGAAYKEDFLKSSPLTKDLPAVTNDCILTLDFDELAPGPRNADAIETIARWLYPGAFA